MDGREPETTTDADKAVEASPLESSDSVASASSRNIFAPSSEFEKDTARSARKRAALWGFGTGMVMLVIVGLCLVLAILAANSVN